LIFSLQTKYGQKKIFGEKIKFATMKISDQQ